MSEVALIVGGGPWDQRELRETFTQEGMKVAVAARNPEKSAMKRLAEDYGVACYGCDAREPDQVASLFKSIEDDLGKPDLVVHNIDGRTPDIFRKSITEADPKLVLDTIRNSTYKVFGPGSKPRHQCCPERCRFCGLAAVKIFTNASAAFKGYPNSGAFAMASHGKSGLAESMARELMPQGIHIAHVPIDAAIGWTCKKMVSVDTGLQGTARMTTWPIPIVSLIPIFIFTDNTAPHGLLKQSFVRGWKTGSSIEELGNKFNRILLGVLGNGNTRTL